MWSDLDAWPCKAVITLLVEVDDVYQDEYGVYNVRTPYGEYCSDDPNLLSVGLYLGDEDR